MVGIHQKNGKSLKPTKPRRELHMASPEVTEFSTFITTTTPGPPLWSSTIAGFTYELNEPQLMASKFE
jgi:hypothetical protein